MNIMEKVQIIDEHGENLTKWEIEFIATIIDEKVTEFTRSMYHKLWEMYDQRVPEEYK